MIILPLAVLALITHFFLGDAMQGVVTNLFIEILAVMALLIFMGNSGVGTFGQVAFMGLGAHVGALLTIDPATKATILRDLPHWLGQIHLNPWLAILITMILVGAFALAVGIPLSRLEGISVGIVTLCLLIVMLGVFNAAKEFTAGARPLFGLPSFVGLWAAFFWAAASIFVARVFRDAVAGLELRAVREDSLAARSIGIDVNRRRLIAWVISGALSAAAGFLLGCYLGVVSPSMFFLSLTFILIAMLIIGGMTTVSGGVTGVLLLTLVRSNFPRCSV